MIWLKSKTLSVVSILVLSITFIGYQNCGQVQFSSKDQASVAAVGQETIFSCNSPSEPCEVNGIAGIRECQSTDAGPQWGSCVVPPVASTTTTTLPANNSCTFKGVTYSHGQSFTAYQVENVGAGGSCTSQVRTCINGSLTGSYQFLTCSVENGDCSLAGTTVTNGQSITAYQSANVPFGQTCNSQTRVCTNKILSGSYTFLACSPQSPGTCNFNGQTIAHNGTVTAYQSVSVAFGGTCSSETRTCSNGVLSGSFSAASCSVGGPNSCTFNGQSIPHGGTATAYQSASVVFGGTCASQTRTCTNGVLSGNYTFASCSVSGPNSCTFNGQSIPHGGTATAYQSASVAFGGTCNSETRTCNNGVLSGTFSNPACSVGGPNSCTFNGQSIPHGGTATAYQAASVAYGATCAAEVRTCSNGVMSGSYTHANCSVGGPNSCTFNGQSIPHGGTATAYQAASVAYGATCSSQIRTCNNGVMSGNYTHANCSVGGPSNCSFNGQTVNHGSSVPAYQSASVPAGSVCVSQSRTCNNGVLGGSYVHSSCSVDAALTCTFNGQTIQNGATVKAYQSSSVAYGSSCASQNRVCTNGSLSGTYLYGSCAPQSPENCSSGGVTVDHGTSVTRYQSTSVAYGSACVPQTRTCNNGTLSGSYNNLTCAVQPPVSCSLNGQTIGHGSSVVRYQSSSVAYGSSCVQESRTCNNGTMSGSYSNTSCTIQNPTSCSLNGVTVNHGSSVTRYQSSSVPFGSTCTSQSRTCNNGTISGSYTNTSCTVQTPSNCSLNGVTVNHGTSVKRYQSASVPFGSSCVEENRTCANGAMTGSYTNTSCTQQPPTNCSLNGVTVNHGSSVQAYVQASVAYGASCESVKQTRSCTNGTLSGNAQYNNCSVLPPANCSFNGTTVLHGQSVSAYQTTSVMEPSACQSQNRVCNNGQLGGSFAYPSCSVTALPAAQCNVYYQYKLNGDFGTSATASDGAWAQKKNQDQNYNCAGTGCGLQVGVSCTGSAEIRLTYQYQEFSTPGAEVTTPWSGTSGGIQWGGWAMLQRATHPKIECGNGLNCGLKVNAETRNGKPCSVSYQYRAENNRISPVALDGAWSTVTGINGGDNCDDGYCGIRIQLNCPGAVVPEIPYDPYFPYYGF